MTEHNIDPDKLRRARDWAATVEHYDDSYRVEEVAAAEVILSLPEPPRPTLADMAQEELFKTKWGQADHATGRCVIIDPYMHTELGNGIEYDSARVVWQSGRVGTVPHDEITPRSDLPRMAWPEATVAEHANVVPEQAVAKDICSEPQPGEAWLIRWAGQEHNAVLIRERHPVRDELVDVWYFTDHRGVVRTAYLDEVDPLARLVPEPQPRTLTTVEDYENAPEGTIIVFGSRRSTISKEYGKWFGHSNFSQHEPEKMVRHSRPATVLRWGWDNEETP